MVNLKNNYFLIILVFVFSTLLVRCRNQNEKTKSDKEDLVVRVSEDIQKSNLSNSKFNYSDLVNKTFLPVHQEKYGFYQYHGDITKSFDMGEDRIRFKRNKIMHLMPIEWYEFYIYKKKYNDDWLRIDLLSNYDYQNNDTANYFPHYFKYNKEKKLLFFSNRRTSDHLEVFMDSAFIAKNEKPIIEKENSLKKYVINKTSNILIGGKNIEIQLPYVDEYIDEYGKKQLGEAQIPNKIEAKLLKASKGELLYLFGEERCGSCPSFSAIYNLDGKNLSYRYTRRAGQEMIVLLSKEEESEVLKGYGFVGNEFLIQFNHNDTPTYIIKNWY